MTVFEFRPPVRQNALLVIGMHRSGTSALTGLLNLLGAYVGDSLLPAVAGVNAKGFWEHVDIVDIHDRLLLALGSSWHDERDLPAQWWTQPGVALFERELAAILLKDFGGMPMWVVKDPRLCRLLPLWRPFFTAKWRKAYVILILRDPREIVQSLARRDQISVERAYLLWFRYLFDAEKWTRDYPRVVVSFEGLLNDWRSVVDRINSELSLDLNRSDREAQRRVDEFLEPNLRHHKNLKPPSGRVACMAVEAYQACLAASASNQLETALAPFVAEVEEVMRLFSSWSEEIQVLEQMRIREINRIKSTVSWRVTAPLRVALNLWRKQRGSSG